jgi:predicted O-methyltransferase YrrM
MAERTGKPKPAPDAGVPSDAESAEIMSNQPNLTLWDKILPDQPPNVEHFAGAPETYYKALFETIVRASGIRPPLEDFDLELSELVPYEVMASNAIGLRLLQFLVKVTGARRVFEIGTYIGLSAMALARALPAGGEIVTVEKFDHFAGIARRNFARNGLADRIRLLEGDAFDLIGGLPRAQPFDIIFIDGNKERYAEYFDALEPLLRPGGLAIIDDCLFHGDVLNAKPRTEKGAGVKAFMELASRCTTWSRLALPISNGIMLMIKPAE